jgi:hypothetical protein
MSIQDDSLLCRKFAFLHNRVLLHRQGELRGLEDELMAMDSDIAENDAELSRQRMHANDCSSEMSSLINKIDIKLKEYNDIVQRIRSFASLQRAIKQDLRNVGNFLWNERPLSDRDAQPFYRNRDLVSIIDAKEGRWFDDHIARLLYRFATRLTVVSEP